MYGECNQCRNNGISRSIIDSDKKSFYYRWKTTNEKRNRAKDGEPIVVKITAIQKVEATYDEMFQSLENELPAFKKHLYRVNHQQTAMSKMKESLRAREVLMIIDFSGNYMCKYSSETHIVSMSELRANKSLGILGCSTIGQREIRKALMQKTLLVNHFAQFHRV